MDHSSVRRELERLHQQMARREQPVHLLRPGLSRPEIEAVAGDALGFPLPSALIDLYGWRNGALPDARAPLELLPGFAFLSLGDAVRWFEQRRSTDSWDARHVPVLASTTPAPADAPWGQAIAVACHGELTEVCRVDPRGRCQSERVTLGQWLAGLVLLYELGADADASGLVF